MKVNTEKSSDAAKDPGSIAECSLYPCSTILRFRRCEANVNIANLNSDTDASHALSGLDSSHEGSQTEEICNKSTSKQISWNKMFDIENHSIIKLDKRLDEGTTDNYSYDRLKKDCEIKPNNTSDSPRHNAISESEMRHRDIKIHKEESLNYKCKEVPPKEETPDVVDKDPCTMSVLRACASVGLSAFIVKKCSRKMLVLLVATAAILMSAEAAPTRVKREDIDDKTQNYLMNFGYLPQSSIEIGNLIMEDQLKVALRNLQAFGGIPETGVVDQATKELLSRRRCGRPDRESYLPNNGGRQKRFALTNSTWDHTDLTWSLSASRRPSSLDAGHTRSVLSQALSVWAQHSKLTFREISSEQADIVISFAKGYHDDAYPFDGRGHILAHAFFPGSGRGGDAHFDDEELWILQPRDVEEQGTSLFAVAAHEFGHSLGLSHSSKKGALMFPWYQGILPNFTLTEDDRNGIQQLYGPRERRVWGPIIKYYPTPSTTTSTTTTTTTTTRRPHHHTHYPHHTPRYPYPQVPTHPHRPPQRHYPTRPDYEPRRRYNATEYNPRRTYEPYPRQTTRLPETTTLTYYPRRPVKDYPRRPDYYPTKSDYPTKTDYPRKPTQKKPSYPEKTPARTPSDKPDTCDTSYDAVALLRGEVFIFKDKWHWRIGSKGLYQDYPIEISRMWKDLPKDLTHIDAVYERPDRKIAFFIGKEYYLFDADHLLYGYPKPLTHLWLPESLPKLDAAMVWGHNGKTYFYSDNMYWKFDEEVGHVELDYPRDMSMWKGVGYNIDSVFQWKDGKTYFFKGKGFWKFNDLNMRVERERQMPSGPFWMGCPPVRTDDVGYKQPYNAEPPAPTGTLLSPSAAGVLHHNVMLVFILSLVILRLSFNIT